MGFRLTAPVSAKRNIAEVSPSKKPGTARRAGQAEKDSPEESSAKRGRKLELSPGGEPGQALGMDVGEEGPGKAEEEVIRTLVFDGQEALEGSVVTGKVGGGTLDSRVDSGGVGAQYYVPEVCQHAR